MVCRCPHQSVHHIPPVILPCAPAQRSGGIIIIIILETLRPVQILAPQFYVHILFIAKKIMKIHPPSSLVTIAPRKLLQFIQGACAAPGVKSLPGQVLSSLTAVLGRTCVLPRTWSTPRRDNISIWTWAWKNLG
ncbi:uncharacterized [Tachysurus ichikawai]